MHDQALDDLHQETKTKRLQDLNKFISKTNPDPTVEKEMRNIQAEITDDEGSCENDCNLLADLRTLHRLDRADSGTQKLLDRETVATLQQGFHCIYGMTLTEAVKSADEGPYSLTQAANKKADGKMRRCWWKYIETLELFQSLEAARLYIS